MSTYTLQFESDDRGEPKTIEFQGEDPHAAFAILEHEASYRHVTVWEGDKCLGSVTRTRKGLWELE